MTPHSEYKYSQQFFMQLLSDFISDRLSTILLSNNEY